jgi:cysteine desulfurase
MIDGFFDYASATPCSESVMTAMKPFFSQDFYNPSALYSGGKTSQDTIKQARQTVARHLGVRGSEVIFTSGCTEANNLAVHGIMKANPGAKVVISSIEHDSVRKAAFQHDYSEAPVDKSGIIDLETLEALITDDVVLVSIIYVNNEIGVVQPLRKVSHILEKIKKQRGASGRPLYFHTDAAQAPTVSSVNTNSLGVDLMSLNGGKIYGPKGSGCLYVSSSVEISPLQEGGGQESGIRSGTENTAAIVGFATAFEDACDVWQEEFTRTASIQSQLESAVESLGCEVIAKDSKRSPAIISIVLPGMDSETAVYKLDKLGFQVSSGSACHAISGEKSHVLTALGIAGARVKNVIRISMGRYSSVESVDKLVNAIQQILA